MTLAEEILLRIEIYGGPEKVLRDIDREWGFFIDGLQNVKPRQKSEFPQWSDRELAYLIEYLPSQSVKRISTKLGRTIPAIYEKAYKLGLLKKKVLLRAS